MKKTANLREAIAMLKKESRELGITPVQLVAFGALCKLWQRDGTLQFVTPPVKTPSVKILVIER